MKHTKTQNFKVKCFNTYNHTVGKGVLIIVLNIDAITVSEAMDKAQMHAKNWNKDVDFSKKVNELICNGKYRLLNRPFSCNNQIDIFSNQM